LKQRAVGLNILSVKRFQGKAFETLPQPKVEMDSYLDAPEPFIPKLSATRKSMKAPLFSFRLL
jgi:hypothetical protein